MNQSMEIRVHKNQRLIDETFIPIEKIEQSLMRISLIKYGRRIAHGSGVVANNRIYSAWHVLKKENEYDEMIIQINQKISLTIPKKIVIHNSTNDIASIELPEEMRHVKQASWSNVQVRPMDYVIAAGFPKIHPQNNQPEVSFHILQIVDGGKGFYNAMCADDTMIIPGGISGAAVFNTFGEVIGLCVASDPRRTIGNHHMLKITKTTMI